MKLKYLFVLLCLSCFLGSCGKPSKLEFDPGDSDTFLESASPSFAEIKAKILLPHCLSCHSTMGTESNLKAWITAGHPEKSSFFIDVENGSMPKDQKVLSTAALELIRNYITQMKTTPTPTNPPVTTGISYSQIKTNILNPYRCTSCHSVGTETSLAKWMNKSSPTQSLLYTSIKNGSMPQGGSDVTAKDQAMVLQYIKDWAARAK